MVVVVVGRRLAKIERGQVIFSVQNATCVSVSSKTYMPDDR